MFNPRCKKKKDKKKSMKSLQYLITGGRKIIRKVPKPQSRSDLQFFPLTLKSEELLSSTYLPRNTNNTNPS